MAVNSNINMPHSSFLDPQSGRPAREWLQWLLNPNVYNITTNIPISSISGGTDNNTIPNDGELLIGNGSGYSLNPIVAGSNITVINGAGTITISAGAGSLTAGSYGAANRAATITVSATGFISSISDSLIAIDASQINAGTLSVARGGTGLASITATQIPYGNGSAALQTSANITYDGSIFKALADIQVNKTIAVTMGAQTISKTSGAVLFASAATSLVVTSTIVTTNSIIIATVASNDATMKSVAIVSAAGSFTLYANAAPTATTRVNFVVLN